MPTKDQGNPALFRLEPKERRLYESQRGRGDRRRRSEEFEDKCQSLRQNDFG